MEKISCGWWVSAACLIFLAPAGCADTRFAKATNVAKPAVPVDRIREQASQSPAELNLHAVRESTGQKAARSPSEPINVQLTSASRVAESSVPDHSLARPPESTDEKL